MRTLKKNQRKLYYAPFMGTDPILDEYGNETLEVEKIYGEKVELELNYSSNTGELDTQMFGDITNYSRVIACDGKCPLKKKDKVFIGDETYEVKKVADSLNSLLIAIGEIV